MVQRRRCFQATPAARPTARTTNSATIQNPPLLSANGLGQAARLVLADLVAGVLLAAAALAASEAPALRATRLAPADALRME
jgi:hypothetical protein